MDYGPSDSSGTDDDLPPSHQNRLTRGPRASGNGPNGRAAIMGNLPYNRVQNDMESEIHWLEQEAYSSVLRAFKAQADVVTWEKEELMTGLRKELRVSDDEHRELLGRVNADDTIRRIREWRQAGGIQHSMHSASQPGHEPGPSPTVSASRKKQKTSHSMASLSLGAPPAMHPRATAPSIQPSSSAAKRGAAVGAGGKKPKSGHVVGVNSTKSGLYSSGVPAGRSQVANHGSSGTVVANGPAEAASLDPLIGRKVMTRWPEDNNFYEAVVTDYNPKEGRHALVYDINTKRETWEWVNLKEISPEDILWEGDEPGISRRGHGGPGRGIKKSMSRSGAIGVGRGRGATKTQSRQEFPPSQNGIGKKGPDKIEMLHTETLIKEIERIFHGNHPDPVESEKAKKLLKEHEQTLLDAISNIAKLEDASDGESEEHPSSHDQSVDGERGWRNHRYGGNQHSADFEDDRAGVGRGEGSDGDHMVTEGGVASDDQQYGDDD
ncbi:protein EMSY-LIKE 3-like [Nymphaea colorata]|nr:protein EMSY-LIKE 3-like [Nymphaea colorata]